MRIISQIALAALIPLVGNFTFGEEKKSGKNAPGSWPGSAKVALQFTELKESSFEFLPNEQREKLLAIYRAPTLKVQSACEEFAGNADLYEWLLDHPDKVVSLWRLLGAKCANIDRQGEGFLSDDGKGTRIEFRLLQSKGGLRLWHAAGKGKLTPFLPAVPVEGVVVLNYHSDKEGIKQQITIYARTDSKAAALITKALGASIPMVTQKVASQMQMFFGAMAWYLEKNPHRTENLLRAVLVTQGVSETP